MGCEVLDEPQSGPPAAGRRTRHPAAPRSCPSGATSSKATPRPPQGRSLPGPALEATGTDPATAAALVPWICDVLLSNHSVKAYGRDLMDFLRHMQARASTPLEVTADHVKFYKRGLLEAGLKSATVATAALGAPRHVPPTCGQGADLMGDGPGHRRRQSPRRPEELDALFDRSGRRSPSWRRSRPRACRGSATWP